MGSLWDTPIRQMLAFDINPSQWTFKNGILTIDLEGVSRRDAGVTIIVIAILIGVMLYA